jgi:hypothetical protein
LTRSGSRSKGGFATTFAIIEALARQVDRFELIGQPKLALNNMTRSLGSLPVRVRLAA